MRSFVSVSLFVLAAAAPAAAQLPNPFRVLLTEVSWGDIDGVEITNHATSPVDLGSHVLKWNDGAVSISAPLGVVLAAGARLVVTEPGPVPAEMLPGTQLLVRLPALTTAAQGFAVALVDGAGLVVDEVVVAPIGGGQVPPTFGEGSFLGSIPRPASTPAGGAVSAERLFGLDGNGGRDWTVEPGRSFGLENRHRGPRGTDLAPKPPVLLNEFVLDATGYVEVALDGSASVDLKDWYLLVQVDDVPPTIIRPWPQSTLLSNSATQRTAVLGDGPAPAALPGTATYANLNALGQDLPFSPTSRANVALYDADGRLADLVRISAPGTDYVINTPRLPAGFDDFSGSVRRPSPTDIVARRDYPDSDHALDFGVMDFATLGYIAPTPASHIANSFLHESRIHEIGVGGLLLAVNGTDPFVFGRRYSLILSVGHLAGTGPFLGLGADALPNWLLALQTPLLSGPLDAAGSAYATFPDGTLPQGLAFDLRVVIDDGALNLMSYGPVIRFDT